MSAPYGVHSLCIECGGDIWADGEGAWVDSRCGDYGRECPDGPEVDAAGEHRGPHLAEADDDDWSCMGLCSTRPGSSSEPCPGCPMPSEDEPSVPARRPIRTVELPS